MKPLKLQITGEQGAGKTIMLLEIKSFLKAKGYSVKSIAMEEPHTLRIFTPKQLELQSIDPFGES